MSEYFTLETEPTDNPNVLVLITSEVLAEGEPEIYSSAEAGDVGSPIAQMLFSGIDGINALTIEDDTLIVTREGDMPWEMLVDEIRDALRDFFL